MEILVLLGRLAVGAYFISHGWEHFSKRDMRVGYATMRGMKAAPVLVQISGIGIMLAGLGVILGVFPQIAIIGLVLFLILVSVMVHHFWSDTDPVTKARERLSFGQNMALAGALLMALPYADMWALSVM